SKIPVVRQEIGEQKTLSPASLPAEIKPAVRRRVVLTEVKSLEDCILKAVEQYRPLVIAQEQEKLAMLRVREARRSFYPALLLEWKETKGETVTEPYRGRSYGLQSEQQLFTGGKLTATLRKEQLGQIIAQGNLDKIKQEFIFNISKAYYELVLARNVVDQMKRLRKTEKDLLTQVEQETKIGSATIAELLNAQSVYNQAIFQVASAEQEFAQAKLRLEKEMFIEDLDVAQLDYRFSRRRFDADLETCLDLALRSRAEIRIIEKTIEQADFGEDIIRSERMPNVSVVGSWGQSGEAFQQRDLNLGQEWSVMGKVRWFFGGNTVESSYKHDRVSPYYVTKTDTKAQADELGAKMSFWDNLAHFTKAKEAYITKQQAEKDLDEMRNKIRQEIEESYYAFKKFSAQLSLAINEIGYRRKQLEIIKIKRQMAEAGAVEEMDAELQLVQANNNLQQALAGMNIAVVSLNRAVGISNYFN
ncbi:MAG: TolC family protein, partial [Candidatus Omnitrophica bacterium]|nr:TolC family protein [Candidatus Omnitrophota bacterium]